MAREFAVDYPREIQGREKLLTCREHGQRHAGGDFFFFSSLFFSFSSLFIPKKSIGKYKESIRKEERKSKSGGCPLAGPLRRVRYHRHHQPGHHQGELHNRKIWVRDGPSSFKKAPRPYTGCKQCKVNLCSACFDNYDHKHRSATPPVVAVV